MFDVTSAFTKQFTPIDGGYVYYPSQRAGGKLVTAEEYQKLVADWHRVAGINGQWKTVGLTFLVILLWVFASQSLGLPESAEWIMIACFVAALIGWTVWHSFAPRRLVKGRPDIAPPRAISEVKRAVRATVSWPLIAAVVALSAVVFFSTLALPTASPMWWVWLVGSGLMLGLYLWLALQKLWDENR